MTRILLVEDDADVLPLLEHILLDKGYEVTSAETATTAAALLYSQPFDLAICDVNLPDGCGLEIADLAKAEGIKALVVTGHGSSLQPGTLARYDCLLKPLRAPELLAGIERRLSEKDDATEVIPFGAKVIQFPKPTH